jgi:hypothetical protein
VEGATFGSEMVALRICKELIVVMRDWPGDLPHAHHTHSSYCMVNSRSTLVNIVLINSVLLICTCYCDKLCQ